MEKNRLPIGTRVYKNGIDGWQSWKGTVSSHDHPHDDVVFVELDNTTYSIPVKCCEVKIINFE